MNKKRNLYEGMYIISAVLSDDARGKSLDRITNGIIQFGGEVHKVLEMGRGHFTYELNGRREGYYYNIYFEVEPSTIDELRREYTLNEDLIRSMTLRTEKVQENLEFKHLAQQS